ncbi:MAG: hypothetical protein LBE08_11115 [Bifidobacteriaceae bacterium]|jgi:hypothetical protein|nr:hypothetical protein [Bifidobacteriaceae bacterium]
MGDRANVNVIHNVEADQVLGVNLYLRFGGASALLKALTRVGDAFGRADDPAYFNRYVLCGLVADLSGSTAGAGLEPFTTPTVAAACRFAPDNQHTIVTFDLSGMSVWLAETEGAGGGLHSFHLSRDELREAATRLKDLEA